jgi:hypothetical protein
VAFLFGVKINYLILSLLNILIKLRIQASGVSEITLGTYSPESSLRLTPEASGAEYWIHSTVLLQPA